MTKWDVVLGIAFITLLGFMIHEITHNQQIATCIDAGRHWIDIDKLDHRCGK